MAKQKREKMNAIQVISRRAKAIRKKSPGKSWTACIKAASAEFRAGKLGKGNIRQTGNSHKKRDVARKAKPPGRRKSATGKTYYERRKNRSDKPGAINGFNSISEVKEANRRAGQFFFSPGTMRFFKSKICSELIGGKYFITSEANYNNTGREWKIREVYSNAHVGTHEAKYGSLQLAKAALKKYINSKSQKNKN